VFWAYRSAAAYCQDFFLFVVRPFVGVMLPSRKAWRSCDAITMRVEGNFPFPPRSLRPLVAGKIQRHSDVADQHISPPIYS